MKHIKLNAALILFSAILLMSFTAKIHAQTPATESENTDTLQGQTLYESIRDKSKKCSDLTDEDFDKIGDYVMSQMMGSADEAMDQAMTDRFGSQTSETMHINMGRRFTGCFTDNSGGSYGMMGSVGMMNSNPDYNTPNGRFYPMMGGYRFNSLYPGPGFGGFIDMLVKIFALVFLATGSIYFIKNLKAGKK